MNTAFQKVYTKITQITKATCSLKAQGVGNDELAIVRRPLGSGCEDLGGMTSRCRYSPAPKGIPTNAEVTFSGKSSYTEGRRGSVRTFLSMHSEIRSMAGLL